MKAEKDIAIYRRMRTQPLWRLLASDHGPTVIGLLQSHLYEKERSLPTRSASYAKPDRSVKGEYRS